MENIAICWQQKKEKHYNQEIWGEATLIYKNINPLHSNMPASKYRNDTQVFSAFVRTQSDTDNDAVVPPVWGSAHAMCKA
jgi:hypothetical protein